MNERPTRPPTLSRGFTLTEVMIVMVLTGVMTVGLISFYLNSQIMWTGASTQVLAQRDGTALLETMRDSTQVAGTADVQPVAPGSLNSRIIFFDGSNNEINRFFRDPADSCVHHGNGINRHLGPATMSKVERFRATYDPALGMVTIDTLRVRSTTDQRVTLSTSIGLYNRP